MIFNDKMEFMSYMNRRQKNNDIVFQFIDIKDGWASTYAVFIANSFEVIVRDTYFRWYIYQAIMNDNLTRLFFSTMDARLCHLREAEHYYHVYSSPEWVKMHSMHSLLIDLFETVATSANMKELFECNVFIDRYTKLMSDWFCRRVIEEVKQEHIQHSRIINRYIS